MGDAYPELAAFAEECRAAEATLAQISDEDWARPGLGEWSLAELTAHLARGAARIADYLDQPVSESAPAQDRVSYFRYDADAVGPEIAARARAEAANVKHTVLPSVFAQGWRASVERAAGLAPDHLIGVPGGPMRLDEYTATRVLEAVVHHMDVRAALDLPAAATPQAARMTMELLEGLLGDARPRNFGRTRFILAATGRLAVDDPRFPVMR